MDLIAAIIGTASTVPQGPQIHVQTSTPMNTTTTCIRSALPSSSGSSTQPSSDVIARASRAISTPISGSPNCRNATTNRPPDTITGPKYGIELKMPARIAQTAACCTPAQASAIHVAAATTAAVNA